MIRIKSLKAYKGFFLKKELCYESSVLVLTGRNGSGKTRLLESIKSLEAQVHIDGKLLSMHDVVMLSRDSISGHIASGREIENFDIEVDLASKWFKRDKRLFIEPYDHNNYDRNQVPGSHFSAELLHDAFRFVAKKANKSVEELTEKDIKKYFVMPSGFLDGFSISNISNEYLAHKKRNLFNMWRNQVLQHDVEFVSEELFEEVFGREPWLVFNEVLNSLFDGKFCVSAPDGYAIDHVYQTELQVSATREILQVDGLSSGERTLLWLAVTIFNSQYRESPRAGYPKLILMDEPDAYLHPQMVVKFYEVLRVITDLFPSKIIITTHSPTTVALSPEGSLYRVGEEGVLPVTKDSAIAHLLDGVSQISISAENQREVFVESHADAKIYRLVFDNVKKYFKSVDPKISLNFLPSGEKIKPQILRDKLKNVFGDLVPEKVEEFIELANGVGSYSHVTGMVDSLSNQGSKTVRGLVDWDAKNISSGYIVVMAENYAYTMENILLDPIFIISALFRIDHEKYSLGKFCGENVDFDEFLRSEKLLQSAINSMVSYVLEVEGVEDCELDYVSPFKLKIDRRYMHISGKTLMEKILGKYPELKRHKSDLLYEMAKEMIFSLRCCLVPKCFEKAFFELQK